MSTKSSLFLTSDNEHCYYEQQKSHYDENNEFIGWDIDLEIHKDNLSEFGIDENYLYLSFKPETEIYKMVQRMDDRKEIESFPTKKELKKVLELARAEIKSCYSKLGILNSNVLEQINEIFYDKLG